MPRSGIRIKFLRFGFFLLIKGLMFIVVKWETCRSADSTTQVHIDKEHYKEKNAKCNTQIKDETFAHIASGANLVHIYIWKKKRIKTKFNIQIKSIKILTIQECSPMEKLSKLSIY